MWAALLAFLKAVLPFLFDQATKPADAKDANAPDKLKKDLNDQLDALPPTPDE